MFKYKAIALNKQLSYLNSDRQLPIYLKEKIVLSILVYSKLKQKLSLQMLFHEKNTTIFKFNYLCVGDVRAEILHILTVKYYSKKS